MGRKGVSKRKPKMKSKLVSKNNTSTGADSNARLAESLPVASIVRGREVPSSKGGTNPSARSNKSQKKR